MMNGRAHFAHLWLPLIDPHGRYIWNARERSTYVASSVYIHGCFKANISPRFRSRVEISRTKRSRRVSGWATSIFQGNGFLSLPFLIISPSNEESRSRGVWNLEARRGGIVQDTSMDTEISVFQGISVTSHREDHGVIRRVLLVSLRNVSELDKRHRGGRFTGGLHARDAQSPRGFMFDDFFVTSLIFSARSVDRDNRILDFVSPN